MHNGRETLTRISWCYAVISLLLSTNVFAAVSCTVSSGNDTAPTTGGVSGELRFCIGQTNASGTGGNTITINSGINTVKLNWNGTTNVCATASCADLPQITTGLTISSNNASGTTIDGRALYRLFATNGAGTAHKADLTLQNLTLTNGLAQGGKGFGNAGGSGGGGLGAGGAIYVDLGQTLTLNKVGINTCSAQGGAGGSFTSNGIFAGGGGGASFSGTSGSKNSASQVGGGSLPGSGTAGGSATGGQGTDNGYGAGNGGAGSCNNGCGGLAVAGGIGSAASPATGPGNAGVTTVGGGNGGYFGGGGGGGFVATGTNQNAPGGGGGNGGGNGATGGAVGNGGGGGGYGSGGAGSSSASPGGGGGGGLGGGGGGAGQGGGGGGGFGAGGGGTFNDGSPGAGGNYGNTGGTGSASGAGGGGGAGIGGAIFVGDGSTLVLSDGSGTSTSTGNTLAGGGAGTGQTGGATNGLAGTATGSDIFLFRGASLSFSSATSRSYNFSIQSDAKPGALADGGLTIAAGAAAVITLQNSNYNVTCPAANVDGCLNNYRGGVKINSGTLSISADKNGNDSILGTAPSPAATNITFGGGVLVTSSSMTINTNRNTLINAGGATIAPNGGTILTYNGAISGTAGLTLNGAGTLNLGGILSYTGATPISNGNVTLSGTNTNTGNITVTNATLNTSNDNNLGNAANTLTLSGSTFNTSATTLASTRNLTIGSVGGATIAPSGTLTYNGVIAGTSGGALILNGTGTLSLGAGSPSTYNGSTIITQGTLLLTAANILPSTTAVNFNGNSGTAALTLQGGAAQSIANLSGNYSSAAITLGSNLQITQTSSGAAGTYTGTISGAGSLTLSSSSTGTLTLTNNNTFSGGTIINGGTVSISCDGTAACGSNTNLGTAPGAPTTNITLSGGTLATTSIMTLNSNRSISLGASGGSLIPSSGTTLTYNGSIAGVAGGALTLSGGGTLSLGGVNSFNGAMNVTLGTLQISNTFSSGSIAVANGQTITTSGINTTTVTGTLSIGTSSGGTGTFAAPYNGSGAVSNFGNLTISNSFTSGVITSSVGTVTLQTNANVSNTLNISAGQLNVTGNAQTAAINNSGAMSIGAATLTATGGITSTGAGNSISVAANGSISAAGQTVSVTGGSVTLHGPSTIDAANYTNTGSHSVTITSASGTDAGIVNTTGNINLSGSLTVTPTVTKGGPWTILSAGGSLSLPAPGSITLNGGLNSQILGSTYVVFFTNVTSFPPAGPVNSAIDAALLVMQHSLPNNPGQTILLNAVGAADSSEQFNQWLQELMPNNNATTPSIFLQDKVFARVETRLASLEHAMPGAATGITAGDLTPSVAMWMSGFGSYARLAPNPANMNFGYISKSYGSIVGFDTAIGSKCMLGMGFGLSRSIVFELSNQHFNTNIVGYHGLMYGTYFQTCDRFLEWLLTGAFTGNRGSRQILINNVVMSTSSYYHGGQAAARFNYGKNCPFGDFVIFAPVGTLQYVASYQPNYTEAFSPAALHVTPKHYQNVLTIGAGGRITFPSDDWWLIGMREMRAMMTYDAVSSNNNVVAAFVVGSPNFVLANAPPAKLAFKTGFDLGFALAKCLIMQFSYDYEVRHGYFDHAASAKLKLVF